jgi:hypothetical protein
MPGGLCGLAKASLSTAAEMSSTAAESGSTISRPSGSGGG